MRQRLASVAVNQGAAVRPALKVGPFGGTSIASLPWVP